MLQRRDSGTISSSQGGGGHHIHVLGVLYKLDRTRYCVFVIVAVFAVIVLNTQSTCTAVITCIRVQC